MSHSAPKRLVLCVEGEGDVGAVQQFVKRRVGELNGWADVVLDPNSFRVGQVPALLKDSCASWRRKLNAASKRQNLGGVLLVVDGDCDRIGGEEFCCARAAMELARSSRSCGAGSTFSVAVVIARQEFETWIIAGVESLRGQRLPEFGVTIHDDLSAPAGDLEKSPRGAKEWLTKNLGFPYKESRDQELLARYVDFASIRQKQLRSFQRFDRAVEQLLVAIREGKHLATPS